MPFTTCHDPVLPITSPNRLSRPSSPPPNISSELPSHYSSHPHSVFQRRPDVLLHGPSHEEVFLFSNYPAGPKPFSYQTGQSIQLNNISQLASSPDSYMTLPVADISPFGNAPLASPSRTWEAENSFSFVPAQVPDISPPFPLLDMVQSLPMKLGKTLQIDSSLSCGPLTVSDGLNSDAETDFAPYLEQTFQHSLPFYNTLDPGLSQSHREVAKKTDKRKSDQHLEPKVKRRAATLESGISGFSAKPYQAGSTFHPAGRVEKSAKPTGPVPKDSSVSITPGGYARKYACNWEGCGKAFTTSGHLVRHKRIHTGEKRYECVMKNCNSRFSRQDNMLQHYRTHLVAKSKRTSSASATISGKGDTLKSPPRQNASGNRINQPTQMHSFPPREDPFVNSTSSTGVTADVNGGCDLLNGNPANFSSLDLWSTYQESDNYPSQLMFGTCPEFSSPILTESVSSYGLETYPPMLDSQTHDQEIRPFPTPQWLYSIGNLIPEPSISLLEHPGNLWLG
ncbi:hypothetical protein O181_055805 [Austropuccinia psidii MF-1]|uniref:C2H2-type domain-containing protein n=1 Tax=Austropuccinia psidii MF-1 TaxID=1389203 RepID=A0A9Q3E511_9BASI|nr:hypothetical protein [Austropuccinia psidii MF-1]